MNRVLLYPFVFQQNVHILDLLLMDDRQYRHAREEGINFVNHSLLQLTTNEEHRDVGITSAVVLCAPPCDT